MKQKSSTTRCWSCVFFSTQKTPKQNKAKQNQKQQQHQSQVDTFQLLFDVWAASVFVFCTYADKTCFSARLSLFFISLHFSLVHIDSISCAGTSKLFIHIFIAAIDCRRLLLCTRSGSGDCSIDYWLLWTAAYVCVALYRFIVHIMSILAPKWIRPTRFVPCDEILPYQVKWQTVEKSKEMKKEYSSLFVC